MEAYLWILWLIAAAFFCAVEAATVGIVSLWFAGGALAAMVTSLLGGALWLQVTVFLVASAALLVAFRPFVRKVIVPGITQTNANAMVGRQALLTEAVDNLKETGALRLDGKEWSVRSETGETLPEGTLVAVVRLEGVRLYVEPVPAAAATI